MQSVEESESAPLPPKLTPPVAVPSNFNERRQLAATRTVEESAMHLAAWSLGLGLGGIVTCGVTSVVGVGFGITSLVKKRTAFGWSATGVSLLCLLGVIGLSVWSAKLGIAAAQQAMLNMQQPTLKATMDLVQWHEALAAARLTDDAPEAWTMELIAERNPNITLEHLDEWGHPYQLEPSGPYEFRFIGVDGVAGNADDIVVDSEGIVRTIDSGDGNLIPFGNPFITPSNLTPLTPSELAALTQEQTTARKKLVLAEMGIPPPQTWMRDELVALVLQERRLTLENTGTALTPLTESEIAALTEEEADARKELLDAEIKIAPQTTWLLEERNALSAQKSRLSSEKQTGIVPPVILKPK
ncbi:MAG: hypothetical protein EXS10_08585 [Phycisphaerales bacterium]|nr:hypothetical protein [Phycisphaerales bacterium]